MLGILYEAFMGLRHSWKKERKKERKDDQPNHTDLPPPSPVLPSQREPDISDGCCFPSHQFTEVHAAVPVVGIVAFLGGWAKMEWRRIFQDC